jgi:hypothetical protein
MKKKTAVTPAIRYSIASPLYRRSAALVKPHIKTKNTITTAT